MLRSHRYASFALAVALVIALSCFAYAGGAPGFVAAHGLDKVLHAAMGFTLTFLLARARPGQAPLAGVVVFLPIALDEYLQRFSASRSSDWNDLLADVIGITAAVLLTRHRAPARVI